MLYMQFNYEISKIVKKITKVPRTVKKSIYYR